MTLRRISAAIIILLFCFFTNSVTAQLEASNWYFGQGAGITFDQATGDVTALTDGQLNTNEGCTAISDDQGNLLFYTDGIIVYNRNHEVMPNGNGLKGNPSSAQSAIIIPKPQDSNIYYIFTVDAPVGAGEGAMDSGLHYYEVDMTLNFGLGDVTTDLTIPNNLVATTSEKIAAINHESRDEILVTTYANQNGFTSGSYNAFYTFTVSATGVNPTPEVSTDPSFQNVGDPRGYMKISADGRFLVSCNMSAGTYLYDYDRNTGSVSNERRILFSNRNNNNGYGAEYSPDSRLLYIAATNGGPATGSLSQQSSTLYQLNLSDNTAISQPFIDEMLEIDTRPSYRGALQLGIDGKIYRALAENFNEGYPFLGVINNPNTLGLGCSYQHDAIPLAGRESTQGLPPFIQSFFALIDAENLCLGDATTFDFETDTPPDSILWEFGDGVTSNAENPSHIYSSAGTYEVKLTLTTGGANRIYRSSVEIYDVPLANPVPDVIVCDTNNDDVESFDLDIEVRPTVLGNQATEIFSVRYYNNITDADNNENALSNVIDFVLGTRQIVAKVFNLNNQDCADTTVVNFTLFTQPVANELENLEECDDDFDGFITFDLTDQNTDLLGNSQNASDFTITYHRSPSNAQTGDNAIPNPTNFRNDDPFNQTIYARIENRLTDQCADPSQSFELIVNPKPVAIDFDAFQCDEDGVADRRTVFALGSFDASVANGASGVNVTYHLNQNQAINNQRPLDKVSYPNTSDLQVIFARVTDEVTECFTISQVTLSVSASDAQDTSFEVCDDDGIEDGLREFDLTLANNSVLANAPADVVVNYYDSLNNALTEQNALPDLYTNTTANDQIIFARAESPDGNCYGISEVQLTVNDLPQIETYEFVEYCGSSTDPLIIGSGIGNQNPNLFTYSWNTGETTESIEVSVSGTYTVTVFNDDVCNKTRDVEVNISELATVEQIIVSNALAGDNGSVEIVVSGNSQYEYSVEEGFAYQDEPFFDNLSAGFYNLFVNDKNGCGVTTAPFSIIGYPKFFTPNNDGFNDFWNIRGVSDVVEPDAEIFIFDRFGKLLAQINPASLGWDGTFNGAPLPSSDYWFKATLSDGTIFSSHFTLKR
ncbi:MAG: T9SS type B sorting domain-containing protein [Nonlabens sp.]